MHSRMIIVVAGMAIALTGHAKTPVGTPGEWKGTIAATVCNGKLYTIEQGGALYMTIPANGVWKQVGKNDFENTALLLASQDKLVSIEKDGSLYEINPNDGTWRPSGKPEDWAGTIAATMLNGKLYTVEENGSLYVTTPDDGAWKQIGNPDFSATRFLFAFNDKLLTLETSGIFYQIDPVNGTWSQAGKRPDGMALVAGTASGKDIYIADDNGKIYTFDLETGVARSADAEAHSGTKFLLAVERQLYTITDNGDLNAVNLAQAGVVPQPAAPTPAKREATNPELAGQLTFKFMGTWKGDPTELEKDPEFLRQKAANPEMIQGVVDLMKGMTMRVTLDGITMTVMEQTVGPFTFQALSANGNTLEIENLDGPKKGVQSRIIFRSDKQIQVIEGPDDGKAMFFRKD